MHYDEPIARFGCHGATYQPILALVHAASCVCLSFPVNYFTLLTAATVNINCIQMTTTTIHHSKYITQTALNMTRRRAPKKFPPSFKMKEDEEQRAFIIGEADKFDTCIVVYNTDKFENCIMQAHCAGTRVRVMNLTCCCCCRCAGGGQGARHAPLTWQQPTPRSPRG